MIDWDDSSENLSFEIYVNIGKKPNGEWEKIFECHDEALAKNMANVQFEQYTERKVVMFGIDKDGIDVMKFWSA